MDGTLTSNTTPGPGRNDNESVFHILQSSRTGVSPSDGIVSYLKHTRGKESYRDAVGIFYSPSKLG